MIWCTQDTAYTVQSSALQHRFFHTTLAIKFTDFWSRLFWLHQAPTIFSNLGVMPSKLISINESCKFRAGFVKWSSEYLNCSKGRPTYLILCTPKPKFWQYFVILISTWYYETRINGQSIKKDLYVRWPHWYRMQLDVSRSVDVTERGFNSVIFTQLPSLHCTVIWFLLDWESHKSVKHDRECLTELLERAFTHFTLQCYRIDTWAIRRPWLTFVNALANSILGRFQNFLKNAEW